jgi:hypothetical protein
MDPKNAADNPGSQPPRPMCPAGPRALLAAMPSAWQPSSHGLTSPTLQASRTSASFGAAGDLIALFSYYDSYRRQAYPERHKVARFMHIRAAAP